MESLQEIEKAQQQEGDVPEVSYTVLVTNHKDCSDILQQVADSMNLQLTLEGQYLPLIAPNWFGNAKHHDKIFLYGPNGCGKSRNIFELIKHKQGNIRNIFIINPRQTIGQESGRIKLQNLVNRLDQKDVVIWDNFPDDLAIRDIESGRKALETISLKDVKALLVALKPKYLELYRGITSKIPELYGYEIAYYREKIKSFIISYGKNIVHFKNLYQNHILPTIDKLSAVLVPLFKSFVRKQLVAQKKMEWLRVRPRQHRRIFCR